MSTFPQQSWERPVRDAILGGIFYDNTNSGANAIAAFSPVSLGTPTDVTNAIAAGVTNAVFGSLYVPCPVSGGFSTSPVAGVAMGSTYSGLAISVCTQGVFPVWANAAIAALSTVFPASNTTRTSAQTPFTNNDRVLLQVMKLPNGTSPVITYDIVLADDTAVPTSTTGNTVQYFPLGIALAAATTQYDLIPVLLQTSQFYA